MGKLKGKVAVVTGGNSGIGLAIAKMFNQEGASVAISGRNEVTLNAASTEVGDGTLAVKGDVRSMSDLDNLFTQVKERFGRIGNTSHSGSEPTISTTPIRVTPRPLNYKRGSLPGWISKCVAHKRPC